MVYYMLPDIIRRLKPNYNLSHQIRIALYPYDKGKFIHLSNAKKICLGNAFNKKNYYDVLGIAPKATKGQIKKSYYRLSLLYHPDQNKSNEASIKFREISEAYEVLGNNSKRKMYDMGLYGIKSTFDPKKAGKHTTHKSVSRNPPATGRTPIYDFDDWSRNHYQTNFERKQKAKGNFDNLNKQLNSKQQIKRSFAATIYLLLSIFFGSTYIYWFNFDDDCIER